jgi:hypothetical protein
MPQLLVPWRNPIFVQIVSHKLGRLLVPYCLVALLISNLFLLHGLHLLFLIGQVLWYALAGVGWLISTRGSEMPSAATNATKARERDICETRSES